MKRRIRKKTISKEEISRAKGRMIRATQFTSVPLIAMHRCGAWNNAISHEEKSMVCNKRHAHFYNVTLRMCRVMLFHPLETNL